MRRPETRKGQVGRGMPRPYNVIHLPRVLFSIDAWYSDDKDSEAECDSFILPIGTWGD